jgi:hypothetical protein
VELAYQHARQKAVTRERPDQTASAVGALLTASVGLAACVALGVVMRHLMRAHGVEVSDDDRDAVACVECGWSRPR